ncbi:GNAT family N-acetyltransferase [Allokutzneria albata]|uniref:Acetyltransferase (GNAT) family protein n=1 Tax=Allokutzneria albata TaxID=211114 RepID=A0A1H0CA18_ALLAB|nr:GNAT family N-acetyltransferase [Allokutzneria albata]SDN54692.1 Acetyltransferase (GNAT) family protein [Allokutzneria albata]
MTIRPYRPSDFEAVYLICKATADAGAPMTGLPDPDIVGHCFAGPYVTFEPELAFVLEDDQGVAGYVIAALDTTAFENRWRAEWAPRFIESHPPPSVSAEPEADAWLREYLHNPSSPAATDFPDHPSHLHIDLLARARGGGHGRRLLATLFDALRAKGSPGVHLLVGRNNTGAIAFYRAVGFTELTTSVPGLAAFGTRLD